MVTSPRVTSQSRCSRARESSGKCECTLIRPKSHDSGYGPAVRRATVLAGQGSSIGHRAGELRVARVRVGNVNVREHLVLWQRVNGAHAAQLQAQVAVERECVGVEVGRNELVEEIVDRKEVTFVPTVELGQVLPEIPFDSHDLL